MSSHVERNFKGIWIPKEVWLSTSLTLQEKVMLVEIDSLDQGEKGCYANNRYFADFFKLSQSRVSEVISSLQKKGYIRITRVHNGLQKEGRSIHVVGNKNTSNPSKKRIDPSECRNNPSGNAKDNNTLNNTKKIPLFDDGKTEQYKPDYLPSFENFWSAYPRKTNKKKSRDIWLRMKPDDELVAKIMSSLAKHKQSEGWVKDKGKFIPHPTTWLNGERWEDEVIASEYIPSSSTDSDDYMMGI